jgi:thiosulfate reductase cytochrome b subunit
MRIPLKSLLNLVLTGFCCVLIPELKAAPLHPAVTLKDQQGNEINSSTEVISDEKSCGECHDVTFIENHNSHSNVGRPLSCLQCHVEQKAGMTVQNAVFDEKGAVTFTALALRRPDAHNCGACHGMVHREKDGPVTVPHDFNASSSPYTMTHEEGAIFSGQLRSLSALNLKNKKALKAPWDIHAERGFTCTDCHFSGNRPLNRNAQRSQDDQIRFDPRSVELSEFLARPDHRLSTAKCQDCHNTAKIHDSIPYAARHLARLSCTACHASRIASPIRQWIDHTVARSDGLAQAGLQNADGVSPEQLNTVYLEEYSPKLIPDGKDAKAKLVLANIITEYAWVSAESGKVVTLETIQDIFMQDGEYRPEIRRAFDVDEDGRLTADELVVATPQQQGLIEDALKSRGIARPQIEARLHVRPIHHGIMRSSEAAMQCSDCHSAQGRLTAAVVLNNKAPTHFIINDDELFKRSGLKAVKELDGRMRLQGRGEASPAFHLFGATKFDLSDGIGLAIVWCTLAGVIGHALFRYIFRSSKVHDKPDTPVYMYPLFKRLWHWLTVACILALAVTGMGVHCGGIAQLITFSTLVMLHHVFAAVLLVNSFLGIFYLIVTGDVRHFLPQLRSLPTDLYAQLSYYLRGLFRGEKHPFEKSLQQRLNPLQKITYLAVLFGLLPLQLLTGLMLVLQGLYPQWGLLAGGLSLTALLHNLLSWMFIGFILGHVYMTTTGPTLWSNLRAMLFGFDTIHGKGKVLTKEGMNGGH